MKSAIYVHYLKYFTNSAATSVKERAKVGHSGFAFLTVWNYPWKTCLVEHLLDAALKEL